MLLYISTTPLDVYKISNIVPRVAQGATQGYLADMSSNPGLEKIRQDLLEQLRVVASQCHTYLDSFEQYAYLWTENRQEYLKTFLLDGVKKDENGEVIPPSASEERKLLPLDKFESEIRKFETYGVVMASNSRNSDKIFLLLQ